MPLKHPSGPAGSANNNLSLPPVLMLEGERVPRHTLPEGEPPLDVAYQMPQAGSLMAGVTMILISLLADALGDKTTAARSAGPSAFDTMIGGVAAREAAHRVAGDASRGVPFFVGLVLAAEAPRFIVEQRAARPVNHLGGVPAYTRRDAGSSPLRAG